MFNYYEENLAKIKNPNDVDIIKPAQVQGGGMALFARINNGESIQLTSPKGRLTFPFEPIYWLGKEMGRFYWESFVKVYNLVAINKTHLTRLCYVNTNGIRVDAYAYFDDGKIIKFCKPTKKFFFKKLKSEIEQACEMEFEDITQEVIKNTKNDSNELMK